DQSVQGCSTLSHSFAFVRLAPLARTSSPALSMEGIVVVRFFFVLFVFAVCLPGCTDPSSTEPSAVAEKRLLGMLSSGRLIAEPDLPYTIHVKDVKGTTLSEVVLKERNARGVIELVVHAK